MALTWEKFVEKLCTEAQSDALYHHPIGSIYQSLDSTSPAELFGGTWSAISAGTFLAAAGTGYEAGSTGGEAKHSLTVDEGPNHTHTVYTYGSGSGSPQPAWTYANDGPVSNGTQSSGSGTAHENRPPYYAVYMWRRTA